MLIEREQQQKQLQGVAYSRHDDVATAITITLPQLAPIAPTSSPRSFIIISRERGERERRVFHLDSAAVCIMLMDLLRAGFINVLFVTDIYYMLEHNRLYCDKSASVIVYASRAESNLRLLLACFGLSRILA